jgi:CRP-like cAMP-binding protein
MNAYETLAKSLSKSINLSLEEWNLLRSKFAHRKIKKHENILLSGDVCKYKTYVANGCLRSYYEDEFGGTHILNFAIEDWWIEDIVSFLNQKPSILCIDAVEDSEILQIDRAGIEIIYKELPQVERFFRMQLEKVAVAQQKRVLMNLSLDGRKKYEVFQQKCGHLVNRLPQHQIAAYLGITPQFLSQIRQNKNKPEVVGYFVE